VRVAAAARPSPPPPPITYSSTNAYSTTSPAVAKKPMRLAIVGSGPAGFYTAHRLMKHLPDAVVDMYEKLPVPYGLVRFGVAPDHPEVKNCQDTFEQVAASERFTYVGNVEVGKTLALVDMKPHYDAIMFAYGASEDRKLGIPGEDTYSGVYSAREFVGWYNGHPDFSHLNPTLDMGEHAVVVGQGNVALDVARILVKPLDQLRTTDIAEHALAALSRSKIKRVEIVGRRGPLQVPSPPSLPLCRTDSP
jgi:adrenodoxin-NADP+ reductase